MELLLWAGPFGSTFSALAWTRFQLESPFAEKLARTLILLCMPNFQKIKAIDSLTLIFKAPQCLLLRAGLFAKANTELF